MTQAVLEHINLTVSDPAESARMLAAIFGWRNRWSGPARDGGTTIHCGGDASYIALYTGPDGLNEQSRYPKGEPLNHLAIVVDDIDHTEACVSAFGLQPFNHASYDPGRRFYFFDRDGIEYEVVSYA
jgi:glyoxylase I family protein